MNIHYPKKIKSEKLEYKLEYIEKMINKWKIEKDKLENNLKKNSKQEYNISQYAMDNLYNYDWF